eukprot:519897-Prymnesium_polylepis.1
MADPLIGTMEAQYAGPGPGARPQWQQRRASATESTVTTYRLQPVNVKPRRRGPAVGTWRSEVSSQKTSDPQSVGSATVRRAVLPDRVS